MKRIDQTWPGYLRNNGKLLLVALATVAMIGLLPQWVSAASTSTTSTTFTSPLPKPPHGPPGDDLRAKIDAIIDRDQLLADVLGISVEELQTARESGTRLDDLITQLGLDEETVHEEVHTAFTEAVQQAVTDGKLTQAEANAILNPPAHPEGDNQRGHGPGQGGAGGEHGPGGPPPNATETPAASTGSDSAANSASNNNTSAANNAAPPDRPGHRRHDGQGASNSGSGTDTASASAANNSTDSTNSNTAQSNSGQPSGPAGHHRRGR